jgi:hypothetical protein
MKTGHSRFMAATDMRVPARPTARRGSPSEKSRLLVGIETHAQQEAVENERIGIVGAGGEHHGAAGNLHAPHAGAIARRVELGEQRDAIAAGHDLERHHQRLLGGVPVEAELGALDRDLVERVIGVDDEALLHQDAAVDHLRNAVGPDLGADARRHRQVGLVLTVAEPHRQHQILGRQPLGLDVDDAAAVLALRQRGAQQPGPLGIVRADRERHAASLRPGQAQVDILERPLLAAALVVDDQVAVLEPELAQVAAVEAGGAEAVDPGQERREVRRGDASGRRRRLRGRRRGQRASCRRRRQRHAGADRNVDRRRRHERPLVGAREHRDPAVGLDAYLHLGAHQAEPLRANASGDQARTGDADLGLRGARHDGAVRIAHHDVADTQRRAAVGVALDLRAADLDAMVAAEILFDRGGEPGRGNVELDRAAAEPPPQGHHADDHDAGERAAHIGDLAQAQPPMEETDAAIVGPEQIAHRAGRRGLVTCSGFIT